MFINKEELVKLVNMSLEQANRLEAVSKATASFYAGEISAYEQVLAYIDVVKERKE